MILVRLLADLGRVHEKYTSEPKATNARQRSPTVKVLVRSRFKGSSTRANAHGQDLVMRRSGVRFPKAALCDVSGHRWRVSWDMVAFSASFWVGLGVGRGVGSR